MSCIHASTHSAHPFSRGLAMVGLLLALLLPLTACASGGDNVGAPVIVTPTPES
ncbi:MAG: hypothetical protein NW237_10335 [Cyanobacteriota bacterium]|nr:hypothetical protein [Cyanobacteriota bacterium]